MGSMEAWVPWAVTAGALAYALYQAVVHAWERFARRWVLRFRTARARRGERKAERQLVSAGYRIVDRQVTGRVHLKVDGESISYLLRVDLIVERDGRRYVAEVKTGQKAPNLQNCATRRQLLEYGVAYEVDGVLLVEPEEKRIRRVEFDALMMPRPPARFHGALGWMLVGAALTVAVYAIVMTNWPH